MEIIQFFVEPGPLKKQKIIKQEVRSQLSPIGQENYLELFQNSNYVMA